VASDSGLRTFVSVLGSLAMTAIHKFGSEDQKRRCLPGTAAGELIGSFDRGQRQPAGVAVLHVGGGDQYHQQQAGGVGSDVPLAAR
jgi:glutaryl-CoA dehydrogenase